jgi:predicted nucleic acid-binding protein
MMRSVFADALYWVALAHRRDQWHQAAVAATRSLGEARIMMTEEILVEFLNAFSSGEWLRRAAIAQVHRIRSSRHMEVIPQTPTSFASGFELYARRLDKEYSLTDCISMQTMRERGITEVLTHDHHFAQEGFTVLIR